MNTIQITNILQRCKPTAKVFKGVFPLDLLNTAQGPGVYVCNTHPSSMPGEHWVVICITKENIGHYFDSFGLPPMKKEFRDFLARTRQWTFNKKPIQHPLSTVCGHYCVLYCINFAKNRTLDDFLLMFGRNPFENDRYVHEYVSSTFNVHTRLIDVNIITNQFGY